MSRAFASGVVGIGAAAVVVVLGTACTAGGDRTGAERPERTSTSQARRAAAGDRPTAASRRPSEPAPTSRAWAPVPHAERPPNWEGPWRPGQTREAPDLRAVYGTDGHIRLTGRDRWGHAIDTTFESPRYFTEAIPALARSLTDPQAMRLRQLGYLLAEPELPPQSP